MNAKKPAAKAQSGSKMTQSKSVKVLSTLSVLAILLVFLMLLGNLLASNRFDDISEEQMALLDEAERFESASYDLSSAVKSYVATSHRRFSDAYEEELAAGNREAAVAALEKLGITSEEQSMLNRSMEISKSLVVREQEAMGLALQDKNRSAIELVYSEEYEAGTEEIWKLNQAINESIRTRTDKTLENYGNFIDATFYLTFLFLALVVLVQIGLIR